MKRLSALVLAGLLAATPVLSESRNPVVLELFTSQGCSSCPPADMLMHKLAGRADVIPLALHVDYWDYLGWKDLFADPAFTRRQHAYARAAGRKMVYTPQMIVNGQEDLVGVDAMELGDLIARHRARTPEVTIAQRLDGAEVVVTLAPVAAGVAPSDLHLVRYTPEQSTRITRGENAGREIAYTNVVDGWQVLGQWDGRAEMELRLDAPQGRPAVLLVQRRDNGPIFAAARLDAR